MMLIKTIFSGFGGQGVLSMGYCLAYAAMLEGKNVTYLPSYGAEVRGGTANCTISISDEEIASPVASEPEFVVALNQPSLIKFQNQLQSGGLLLLNASLIDTSPTRGDIEIVEVPATRLAEEMGSSRVANMVMLGSFIKVSNLISFETMMEHLKEILGEGKTRFLKQNKDALIKGYNYL
jgi:2-oxoglutarate ferredoxin oxidoreductase subunit gamma